MRLRRDIKTLGAAFLVLNGLIGAGIFALPAVLFARAGSFSIWLFLIIGLLMIAVVLTFAELASYFSETGGPVVYARRAFGAFAGFQTGWLLYLSRLAAIAANTNVLVLYLGFLVPQVAGGWLRIITILVLTLALTVINVVGIKKAIRALDILTVLKVAPLLVMIGIGLGHVTRDTLYPGALPEIDGLGTTVLLLLYAFIGFEGALLTAGETANPKRTLPRALVLTVVGVTLLYFLIQLVYVAVAADGAADEAPLVAVGRVLAGPAGALVISLAAIFSLAGNLTNAVINAPRLTFALARDGSLPRWFSHVHDRFSTPDRSILLVGALTFILAVSGTFVWLAVASTLSRLLVYAVCIAALPFIRREMRARDRAAGFRPPGGWLLPGVGLVLCLWAAAQSAADAWMFLAALMAVGIALYGLARRRAATATAPPAKT